MLGANKDSPRSERKVRMVSEKFYMLGTYPISKGYERVATLNAKCV